MASTTWTPYGVAFTITATSGTVTRTSATAFTVKVNASWKVYWSGASTNYGMTASSGGGSVNLNSFGTYASSGSGSFTGTYSISGYSAQTKSITVTFKNTGADSSSTKSLSLSVSVPAWPSYTVSYNANGGSGAPSSQTKYKDVKLVLSTTKPTRTGYSFLGWGVTNRTDIDEKYKTEPYYYPGDGVNYNGNQSLIAIWKANTYTVKYDANGGTGAPANQTKTYGVALTLSSTKPTRTNYNFLGWATSASATTKQYSAGGTYSTNSAVTLYAVWELAYWKPKITNVSVNRCASDGTADEFGTYAKVYFKWETCQLLGDNLSSTTLIDWGSGSETVSVTGASGTVSQIVGDGAIDIETSYTFTITVTDNRDSANISRIIGSSAFAIDFLAGGKGVAFGKAASREGMDVDMPAYFGSAVYSSHSETAVNHTHSATGTSVSFGVGSGGYNRGVYDRTGDHWIIYSDSTHPLYSKIPKLHITSTTDVSGTADNDAPLIIGSRSGTHMALDGNEILVKTNGTTTGTLNLNTDGGLVSIGSGGLRVDGRMYAQNKVLCSGGWYMTANQTATLSEAVSAQPHGIVIVWSGYDGSNATRFDFNMTFIPKQYVADFGGGCSVTMVMASSAFWNFATKTVYVSDTTIVGTASNSYSADTTRGNGIADAATYWVLRQVIGV